MAFLPVCFAGSCHEAGQLKICPGQAPFDPWAEVLRKVWGGFGNGLTGMGFIFPKPCFP
jgi:hypothetical protein